jgi:DNA-binding MarR family transcriptional regulator
MDHTDHAAHLEQARTMTALLRKLLGELTAGSDDPALELPLAQLRVCNVLRGQPWPMSALGHELGVSLSAITQIADRLERVGLVKRVAKGADRRVRSLQLTARGEKMLQVHEAGRVRRMAAALERLTPEARRETATALQALMRAAAAVNGENGDPRRRGTPLSTAKALL